MARIGRNTSKRAPSVAVLQFLTAPQFEQLYVRYSEDSPDVLRGLDLHIPSRSKVGVVGKTGGGKVSVMKAALPSSPYVLINIMAPTAVNFRYATYSPGLR